MVLQWTINANQNLINKSPREVFLNKLTQNLWHVFFYIQTRTHAHVCIDVGGRGTPSSGREVVRPHIELVNQGRSSTRARSKPY